MGISVGYWKFVALMLPCLTKINQNTLGKSSTGGSKMLDTILTTLGIFGLLAFIGIILTVLLDSPSDY
jgi:Sec-independent protein secretion pathway component TatC